MGKRKKMKYIQNSQAMKKGVALGKIVVKGSSQKEMATMMVMLLKC